MSKRVFTWKDIPALFGAGTLGHTWVAIEPDGDTYRQGAQTSYGADAVRLMEEDRREPTGSRIRPEVRYFTRAQKGWREIHRRAAVLDSRS